MNPGDLDGLVEHGYADNAGVRTHYATLGEGPLVVLVHGFPDYWETWRHQMPALAADHRVVAVDLRGYNLSDKPRGAHHYALETLAGDVETVIAHHGARSATVVGHDWGGAIAWYVAMTRPELVERLVVLNMPHPAGFARELATNPEQARNSAYARRFAADDAHLQVTAEELVSWLPVQGEDRLRHLEALRRSDIEAMLSYYKVNYPREGSGAQPASFPQVKAPVLAIHGLDDQAILPGGLNSTWERVESDLTIVTLPGAGHFVQHDAAQAVTDTMVSWLSARRPAVP